MWKSIQLLEPLIKLKKRRYTSNFIGVDLCELFKGCPNQEGFFWVILNKNGSKRPSWFNLYILLMPRLSSSMDEKIQLRIDFMKRNYYIVSLIMLIFFVISFITNVVGPLIPDIIKEFNLSLMRAGLLSFAFFIAYGVMSVPSGMLVEKYKEKKIMIAGFIVAFFGALLLVLVPNYLTIALSLFFIGCGMAMLQVVLFPLLRTSGGEEHYAFTAVLAQLIFGLASFISPLVYSYLVLNIKNTGNNKNFLSLLSGLVPDSLPDITSYWPLYGYMPADDTYYFIFKIPQSNTE